MEIQATYKQELSTLHPDLILEVEFKYRAFVHKNEEVTVLGVWHIDGEEAISLRVTPTSGGESSMFRFLANIREHARIVAYKQSKK